jgi:hypothetical protein
MAAKRSGPGDRIHAEASFTLNKAVVANMEVPSRVVKDITVKGAGNLFSVGVCKLMNEPTHTLQESRQSAPTLHVSIPHPCKAENKAPNDTLGGGDMGVGSPKMIGPLYRVRIVAPMTQNKTPSTLACPSLLSKEISSTRKITAMTIAQTGMQFIMIEENITFVYCNPSRKNVCCKYTLQL